MNWQYIFKTTFTATNKLVLFVKRRTFRIHSVALNTIFVYNFNLIQKLGPVDALYLTVLFSCSLYLINHKLRSSYKLIYWELYRKFIGLKEINSSEFPEMLFLTIKVLWILFLFKFTLKYIKNIWKAVTSNRASKHC